MNLKLISALAAAGLLSATAPAFAEQVNLNFEGVTSSGSIQNFYNGGQDTGGASGPNYLASFGLDLQGLSNPSDPLSQIYSNSPSPGAVMSVNGAESAASTSVNFGYGLLGNLSFAYSLTEDADVTIWSGLNGTGSVLETLHLTANAQGNGCSDTAYCFWSTATATLNSAARSIQFADAMFKGGFDDLKAPAVPLPAAGWLLMSALGGLGAWRKKRAAA